jgi:hypothetical protein
MITNHQYGTAYIAAHQYFSKTVLPFGTGIVVSPDQTYARRSAARRPYLRTKPQWYELAIPYPEQYLYLDRPLAEQPFPLVHALLSNRALAVLFAGERAFAALRTGTPEEQETITREETTAFYHRKREDMLALPTVSAFCDFILRQSVHGDPEIISAFLYFAGISGIRFHEAGEERLLVFDPRKDTVITAVRREPREASAKTTIKGTIHE